MAGHLHTLVPGQRPLHVLRKGTDTPGQNSGDPIGAPVIENPGRHHDTTVPLHSAIPVGVAEGVNITVYFDVVSYAGTMTIAATVDPDHFPDLDTLIDGLRAELDLIIHAN